MHIVVLSPGISDHGGRVSTNLGDCIIHDAVKEVLSGLFPLAYLEWLSTHQELSETHMSSLCAADMVVVGGSNLLGNDQFYLHKIRWFRQWKITLQQARRLRVVLLGVGWRRYEGPLRGEMRDIVRSALSPDALHSVRDGYTSEKLREAGIANVINTSCPSVWALAGRKIAGSKCDTVLTMLCDYKPSPITDWRLLRLLRRLYRDVVLWPQGEKDIWYLTRLGFAKTIRVLDRSFEALEHFLKNNECDYVGNRLHGGLACVRAGKRALILAVDNRAAEIAKDIGLPCAGRHERKRISEWIHTPCDVRLHIPEGAIQEWKSQFRTRRICAAEQVAAANMRPHGVAQHG